MQLAIHIPNHTIAEQIFDRYFAYRQSLDTLYQPDISIKFVANATEFNKDQIRILLEYMPKLDIINYNQYDFVFFCNGAEPLQVANPVMADYLTRDNVYLICNSYVSTEHVLRNKILWIPDAIDTCRQYWTRAFYPQHYQNPKFNQLPRNTNLCFINGVNRSWRHYLVDLLKQGVPGLSIKSDITSVVQNTIDVQWETSDDQEFRQWVNSKYQSHLVEPEFAISTYYNNSITIGIENKFGSVPPGYFILSEYFQSRCVIFPEAAWINNEVAVTEKILKCCYSQSIPWPIGGANINQLYNTLGFFTAWNLLPDFLKEYDSILNHQKRYEKLVEAIAWVQNNPKCLVTTQAQKIINQNLINFLTFNQDCSTMLTLDQILLK